MTLSIRKDNTPLKVTGTTSVKQAVIERPVFIKFVYWYKPTTAAHLFVLKDSKGFEITKGYCETGNWSQYHPIYGRYDGIYCDDLDSGELLIYLG